MSQNLASLVALSRSFGPGRDLFDAPEDAFHAVIDAVRVELEPTTILMFLTVESLIRSLKNQRRPAVHSVHDSRWQRDRASGERLMCRMMTQLMKLTQPPKAPRAAKATPKNAAKPTLTLYEPTPTAPIETTEPTPPIILPMLELAAGPVEPVAKIEAANPEPTANAPVANPPEDQEQEARFVFANDGTYKAVGRPRRGPLPSEVFKAKLKNFNPAHSPADAPHLRNGTPFSP
ncbi:MAG: hypothetical protein ABI353_04725 [Isosphaeraceae bacterium]